MPAGERFTCHGGYVQIEGARYEGEDFNVAYWQDSEGNYLIGLDVGKVVSRSEGEQRNPCAARGHRLGSSTVQYADGLTVGMCVRCEERIEIPRFAGGRTVVEADALLRAVKENSDEDGVFMFGLAESRRNLEADLEAVQRSLATLKIAERLLVGRAMAKLP